MGTTLIQSILNEVVASGSNNLNLKVVRKKRNLPANPSLPMSSSKRKKVVTPPVEESANPRNVQSSLEDNDSGFYQGQKEEGNQLGLTTFGRRPSALLMSLGNYLGDLITAHGG
ncbi:hypothetical protein BS50DRAFT_629901 [Corynespora cassiicola Philippines]|uniref:Uncharacterized protein n=1 Tax=Corynespora cassiicola Philippines TaxID=1448308 RepID=A0A2T2P2A9_CORCC|nr:hypothetical protein BS50DRAFT_629901 [Corynespora cassiicola Philippines]